jgi:hypothetical protein
MKMAYGYTPGQIGAPMPPQRSTSTLAIVSLIAGILGLSLLPFIGSIVALITAGMAKKDIQSSAGMLGGEGLATAGQILGWIGIALGVLGGCLAGLFFLLPLCLAALGMSFDWSQFNYLLPIFLSII